MFDPELDELRREFLAEADEKVREMEARAADRSPETLERLTYLSHQLKGSGGSYGFQVISDDAAELEKAAEQLSTSQSPDGLTAKIQRHIANLRYEIDRRTRELSVQ